MDYSQFLNMRPEVSLMALIVIVFLYDLIAKGESRRWFRPLTIILLGIHIAFNFMPQSAVSVFGGMYEATTAAGVMKTILAFGTFIVLIQSGKWISRPDTNFKEGEYYELTLCTLLGMNMMMSAGHFLMFFLGLEMASIPMACLVALDKYRHKSAEAAAKFILTAVFSSGIMLYGLSFIYGSVGTLYFDDVAAALFNSHNLAMNIMGLVFFFSGLGFKISLVPFHFWTAD